jgi:hypothetical protein
MRASKAFGYLGRVAPLFLLPDAATSLDAIAGLVAPNHLPNRSSRVDDAPLQKEPLAEIDVATAASVSDPQALRQVMISVRLPTVPVHPP